ncbi:Egl nine 1 [Elasticomyces elasticus]|nr:Egl nine 1 [Elasticomyces elasticus]KAK3640271.1 Egl nine 1 [Elasticomyces elasticus]KAK4920548.1 Egl nine 1 [Elasticomyces elasticus]KAK5758952.1 Egl nine 1 [Elasticomyces elasticus]
MANSIAQPRGPIVCGVCGKDGYLLKCARCKVPFYCSKPCQVQDWPVHKLICKINAMFLTKTVAEMHEKTFQVAAPNFSPSSAFVPAVIISLKPGNTDFTFACASMPMFDAADPGFVELPATNAIGFPLGAWVIQGFGEQVLNTRAASLYVDVDPESARFGEPTVVPVGGVLVARRNGRHMKIGHAIAVVEYLRVRFGDGIEEMKEREAKGERVDRREVVEQFLGPEVFKSGTADMIKKSLEAGVQGWGLVECPELDEVKAVGVAKVEGEVQVRVEETMDVEVG